MPDLRWPLHVDCPPRNVLPEKLYKELCALANLGPQPDALGNMQSGVRMFVSDAGIRVEYRDGGDAVAIAAAVAAHIPTNPS